MFVIGASDGSINPDKCAPFLSITAYDSPFVLGISCKDALSTNWITPV